MSRFAATFGPANGKGAIAIEAAALERLERETWPGNIRELQNFVERLVVLADGTTIGRDDVERELARSVAITPAAAPSAGASTAASTATLDDRRRVTEREALREALDRMQGNRTLAARILGISRRSLYNKLAEHGLG